MINKSKFLLIFTLISLALLTTTFADSLWNKKDEEANSLLTYNNNVIILVTLSL